MNFPVITMPLLSVTVMFCPLCWTVSAVTSDPVVVLVVIGLRGASALEFSS